MRRPAIAPKTRLNQEITSPEVRLIDLDGQQVGIVSITEALERAAQAGFDLAEIAPKARPPVVKILDWDKYRYEQTKQDQRNRKSQRNVEIKQVRLGLKIGDHDLDVKAKRASSFLSLGHKVKVSLRFRGREIARPELGRGVLDKFMSQLADAAVIEQEPQQSGREINMVIVAKK